MSDASLQSSQHQSWEIFPKIFAVAIRNAEVSGSASTEVAHGEALEELRERLHAQGLSCYGTFDGRLYFGLPNGTWEQSLSRFAFFRLFAQVIETKSGHVTTQDFWISAWGARADEKLLRKPDEHATSSQLGDAFRRSTFLPLETYQESAPARGLLSIPDGSFSVHVEDKVEDPIVCTIREEDVYRAVFKEAYGPDAAVPDISEFPALVRQWLASHPDYPYSAYMRIADASFGQIEALLERFAMEE